MYFHIMSVFTIERKKILATKKALKAFRHLEIYQTRSLGKYYPTSLFLLSNFNPAENFSRDISISVSQSLFRTDISREIFLSLRYNVR